MRLVLDEDLCQGHAMCELEAPSLFDVPKTGPASILAPEVSADHEAAARAAVRNCPTHALTLKEI
jgi:ferredoxin